MAPIGSRRSTEQRTTSPSCALHRRARATHMRWVPVEWFEQTRCRCRRLGAGAPQGRDREAYLPTESPSPGSQARLPASHVDTCRPQHRDRPPPSWKAEAVGLIGGVRGRQELDALRVDGLRATAGPLRLIARFDDPFAPPRSRPQWRIAFAISRSVGTAVVRNRARRRLRAQFRELVDGSGYEIPPGAYLVSCRRPPHDSAEARTWLISALQRLTARSPER